MAESINYIGTGKSKPEVYHNCSPSGKNVFLPKNTFHSVPGMQNKNVQSLQHQVLTYMLQIVIQRT